VEEDPLIMKELHKAVFQDALDVQRYPVVRV
jgi:hypothetical protein